MFRSAHTIKGMAGMIGHRRMTDVTHALENALDGVRKNTVQISPPLINLCLEAVDCLRSLREEVATLQVSEVDIAGIVASLKDLGKWEKAEVPQGILQNNDTKTGATVPAHAASGPGDGQHPTLQIHAKIDIYGMASAARAFQLMLALQDLGEIQAMTPTQAQIETATSVGEFAAELVTDQPFEKVSAALTQISGVDEISIDGRIIFSNQSVLAEQPQEDLHAQVQSTGKLAGSNSSPAKEYDPGPNPAARERRTDPAGRRVSDLTFRMNVEHMDSLMNLVGELIIDRNHLKQVHGRLTRINSNYDQILETVVHLGQIADQLQEEVMGMRMLPIGNIFNKFPRMIHDMSQRVGKDIHVVIHGEETEMDRMMIEEIYDPLIHLVRNSVDHGIEPPAERLAAGKPEYGTLTMAARHEQGRIILTVQDDGGGIDGEKLRQKAIQKGLMSAEEAAGLSEEQSVDLMFLAGLSTVEKATEFSGRGVGLDIVKTNIQHVNGSIQVQTTRGQGTQFQIVLPLTLAIVPSLLVRIQDAVFAIPMVMITETLRLEESEIQYICQKPVVLLRGNVLTLVRLSDIFNLTRSAEEKKHLFAVVIQSGKQQIGLIVDSLIGEEEVVVKPLGTFIGDVLGISSAAILGSGQVALIIDVFNLFKLVGI